MKFSIQKLLLLTALVGLQSAVHAAEIFAADADAGLTPSVRKGRYKYVALSDNDDDGAEAPTLAELKAPSRKKAFALRAPSNQPSRRALSTEAKRQARARAAQHFVGHKLVATPEEKAVQKQALLDLLGTELEPVSTHREIENPNARQAAKDNDKVLKERDRARLLHRLKAHKVIRSIPGTTQHEFTETGKGIIHDLINSGSRELRRHHRRGSEGHDPNALPGSLFSPIKSKSRQQKERDAANSPFEIEMRRGNRAMAEKSEVIGMMQYIVMQADPKARDANRIYIDDLVEGFAKTKSIKEGFDPKTHVKQTTFTPLGFVKLNRIINQHNPELLSSPIHRPLRHSPKQPGQALHNSPTALTLEPAQEEKE